MPYPPYWNKDVETIDKEALRELQSEKLRRQVEYVYNNCPFYHEHWKKAGIKPSDIRSVDDLHRLPFVTKEDIRESQMKTPPLGSHQGADWEKIIRIHASSGTTGAPSFMAITKHDDQVWTEVVSRVFWTNGFRPYDRILFGLNIGLFVGGVPVVKAIENIGCTLIPVGTGDSKRLMELGKLLKANALVGTPSYMLYLAEIAKKEMDLDPKDLGIRLIHVGGEPGGGIPGVRKKIEREWGSKVVEGLGNSDIAPVIWGECEYQNGMHFCAQEFIIPEIIDPESLEPIELEEDSKTKGELVYTVIDREATPILRFRSHDIVEVWTDPCECGRTSFRVRCIGRVDDMIIYRGVNIFPSMIQDVIANHPNTTGALQIVIKKGVAHAVQGLEVEVEYQKDYSTEKLDALRRDLENLLKNKLFVKIPVILKPEGTLPRFEKKAKLIRRDE